MSTSLVRPETIAVAYTFELNVCEQAGEPLSDVKMSFRSYEYKQRANVALKGVKHMGRTQGMKTNNTNRRRVFYQT